MSRAVPLRHRTALTMAVALGALVLPCRSGAAGPARTDRVERSVVRIVNFTQRGDWFSPWELSDVRELSGSGFVIGNGEVLTNAHVVSDSRLLLLYRFADPAPHIAEIVHVAHDCDLALVRPREAASLEGVPPLAIGNGPSLRSTVETIGYPAGGSQVSSTRGVVSRIDAQVYAHSGIDQHMTIQTDAAINPGNSGGPVVQDGRVVGVAFQAASELENVGYAIPPEVVRRFLRDIEDGRYDGYPELGDISSGLENPAARQRAGMLEGETGVRVDSVHPASSAAGLLLEGDIMLQVDGQPIANDGTVADGEFRVPFGTLVDRKQVGESVRLRILRAGRRLDVPIPLKGLPEIRIHANTYDRLPRYYVYGGLVFVPLDLELLKTYGNDWYEKADRPLLDAFLQQPFREPELATRERVVLLRRLDHPVNSHLAWFRYQIVERVNGRPIRGLKDLVEAVEKNDGEFQVFELEHFRRLGVLDRRAAEAANEEILKRYGVPQDRRLE